MLTAIQDLHSPDGKPLGEQTDRIVGIIGAGPGGICAGVRLLESGHDNFVILEKASGVGGTWWHNRYPGLACDIPSHLYSFSFEAQYDWSRPYATQPEIHAYMEHVVNKYGLAPHIRLDTEVESAKWSGDRAIWQLTTVAGEQFDFHVVIAAMGMFNLLNWPEIPGLDSFGGTLFHSARWNCDHDLTDEHVGVIGSAASAIQFVPEIAKEVDQLYLFQRSANWVLPKDDEPYTEQQREHFRAHPEEVLALRERAFRLVNPAIPFSKPEALHSATQEGLRSLELVEDLKVRQQLTPSVPYGCQRPLISNEYYPTFNRPNVELVTDPIEGIREGSIVTRGGVEHRVDTIVVATGFLTTKFLSAIDVIGRGGRRLEDAWAEEAHAYLGITTAGFPNLFMLYGPNTNNGSIIYMIECQVEYVLRQLGRLESENLLWIDVKPDVEARYCAQVQHDMKFVGVWAEGNCHNYYRGPSGKIVTQWPHALTEYRDRTAQPDPESFESAPGWPSAPDAGC